jgi:peptidyl-prolyl cis-trans isomerase SurA
MKPFSRILLLLIPSLAILAVQAPAEIVERVIAAVNGDIITLSEFEARQIAAVQQSGVSPDQIPLFLRQNNARLLQEAVDELLVLQRGDLLGIHLPDGYIDEVVGNIKEENNITSEAQFQAQLEREGMTLEDLKRSVERSIVRRQVLSSELKVPTVTEAEGRAWYEERIEADFTNPATARLQEIVISGDTPELAARVEQVLSRARAGEDFAALAREFSQAPTAASGGELGTLVFGEMNPEIEQIANALPPGGISDPRQTPDGGVQILRVVEKTEASVVPFETVKQDVLRRLAMERQAAEYETWIASLRDNAVVDYRVREVGLQLDVPTEGGLLEDARELAEPGAAGPPAPSGDEFSTSGSTAPRRGRPGQPTGSDEIPVSGPDNPAAPAPAPEPTPTPPPQQR